MTTQRQSHRRLAQVPGFEKASPDELSTIDAIVDECSRPANRVLIRQGAPSRQVFIVRRGLVEERVDDRTIAIHRPGAMIGAWSARHGIRSPTSAVSLSDVDLLVVTPDRIDTLLMVVGVRRMAEAADRRMLSALDTATRDILEARDFRGVTGNLGAVR